MNKKRTLWVNSELRRLSAAEGGVGADGRENCESLSPKEGREAPVGRDGQFEMENIMFPSRVLAQKKKVIQH